MPAASTAFQLLKPAVASHHLGACPAKASDITGQERVCACVPYEAMADASYEVYFGLPSWEGSGPETSFTDEDSQLFALQPRIRDASKCPACRSSLPFRPPNCRHVPAYVYLRRLHSINVVDGACNRPTSNRANGGEP